MHSSQKALQSSQRAYQQPIASEPVRRFGHGHAPGATPMRSLSLAEIAELCDPGFNPLPILLRPAQILSNDWGSPQSSLEDRDLQQLLWHRHRVVQMRTRVLNQLQAIAMNEGIQRRGGLRSVQGRKRLEQLPLGPWAARRREVCWFCWIN
jgi:hypothetical protein